MIELAGFVGGWLMGVGLVLGTIVLVIKTMDWLDR